MMWNYVEGKLGQYAGVLIEGWGKLIRSEPIIIRGKREQLFGIIRERYGISKADVQDQVNEFSLSLWCNSLEQEPNTSSGNREQARGAGQR